MGSRHSLMNGWGNLKSIEIFPTKPILQIKIPLHPQCDLCGYWLTKKELLEFTASNDILNMFKCPLNKLDKCEGELDFI